MPKQPAIPGLRDAMKKKVTRREQFLAEMDAVVPWTRLLALIAPHYPKVGPKGGRPPMPIETMLRVYFLQNWYALSDPMAEETLYDSEAMRRFAGIELGDDRIPDETTILNFRHLLERQGLGVDADSGIVHSLENTTVKVHPFVTLLRNALPGNGHPGLGRAPARRGDISLGPSRDISFRNALPGKFWGVIRKPPRGGALHPVDADINRVIARVRARVEHPFRVLKRQFEYLKTRYRGLAKNRAQLFALFALGNMFLVRRRLLA
jgi:hypothetical protein